MKTLGKILVAVSILVFTNVMAQQDLSGTWQGKLALGGDATLTVQFIMAKEADGSWSAVVNSPDTGGIKNVKADTVTYDGTNLKIDVASLSGGYTGSFKDGKFDGTWTQAGSGMPLSLAPYTKPVLSQADMDLLAGEWHGKLEIPAGALTLVFRFEKNPAGELIGFAKSPDQGPNEIPVGDIELVDGVLQIKIPANQADIKGKLTGTEFAGEFKQGGSPIPLTLSKGKYEPPKNILSLSKEAMDQLMGEWHGEVDTPMGKVMVVYRFETNAAGEYVAFRDNPDQGSNGISVSEAALNEGNVMIKTPGPGGEFSGKLAGEEIAGEIKGPMGAAPLLLKKGKYIPPSYQLNLASNILQQLEGKWTGKLATPQQTLTLEFRFEKNGAGEYYGFVDSPDQRAMGLKIIESSFSDGELSIKIKFPAAEFKGKLNGSDLTGNWIQMGGMMPLTMKKG